MKTHHDCHEKRKGHDLHREPYYEDVRPYFHSVALPVPRGCNAASRDLYQEGYDVADDKDARQTRDGDFVYVCCGRREDVQAEPRDEEVVSCADEERG